MPDDSLSIKKISFLSSELYMDNTCFAPNTVSKIFIQNIDTKNKTVLDVGCGIGCVGIEFLKSGAKQVYGIDIYDKHIEYTIQNAQYNGVKMEATVSDIYSALKDDRKYDIIASDISGCAKEIADITTWFPKTVPTPENGWEYTVRAIKESKKHLLPNGEFYSAVLSFSDRDKIEEAFNDVYENDWEIILEKNIPFSKELYENLDIVKKWPYKEIRNRLFWTLYIYKGINKINTI
jgi:methylase of polypeptide subunit release factors